MIGEPLSVTPHLRLVALADIADPGPPQLLCGPLLVMTEPTVLYGEGGMGKSLLAGALALSIGSGLEIIPDWHPRHGEVAILDFEAHAGIWRQRLRRMASGVGLADIPGSIRHMSVPGDIATHRDGIVRELTRVKPSLVILDSVGAALPTRGDNSDPRVDATDIFAMLRQIEVTSLVIDHSAKGGGLYGSVYKFNWAREVYELSSRQDQLRLRHTKANYRPKLDPIKIHVEWDGEDGPITFTSSDRGSLPDDPRPRQPAADDSQRSRVFALLDGDPMLTNGQLTKLTGAKPATVRQYRHAWKQRSA